MRIGYFGGSFDPPHRGHLAVARLARDRFSLDRVLLAPTARQPLKQSGPEASWADRLRMTELLVAGEPRGAEASLEASNIDGPQPNGAPNYTVDTLRRLRAAGFSGRDPRDGSALPPGLFDSHTRGEPASGLSGGHHRREFASSVAEPTPELFVILGADAFLGLPQWREPDELLALAEWIVASRPGVDLASTAMPSFIPAQSATQTSRVHLLDTLADPVSATELRRRLHAGQDCHGLIPDPVLAYLISRHLYGA